MKTRLLPLVLLVWFRLLAQHLRADSDVTVSTAAEVSAAIRHVLNRVEKGAFICDHRSPSGARR